MARDEAASEMPSYERLRRLNDATAEITRLLALDHRISAIVRSARELIGADAAALLLRDAKNEALEVRGHEGLSEAYASRQRVPMERARAAYRGPDVHLVVDLREAPLGDAELIRAEGLAKVLAVPLVREGELIGALSVYTKDPGRAFSDEDVDVAHILAAQAAIAVTNSVLYEEAVAQRRLHRELLEALGEGVIVAWADGRIEANPRAREILGTPATAATLDEFRRGYRAQRVPSDELPFDRALRGESFSGEFSFLDPATGETRDVYVTTAPVRGVHGEITAAVASVHDLSEARMADREREQFLSIVSHELRTPLTPLKALAQLIRTRMRRSREKDAPLDLDSMDRNLAAIERQVDRMNGLVNDLLSVSRAQRGALRMEPSSFDLVAIVREVVQHYVAATAEEGRHEFTMEAPPSVQVRGDQARMEQLLMNLVGNAVKYSPTGGPVRISIAQQDHEVEIAIGDDGIGILAEDLPKLGQPFVRGSGRAATFAGMGVGLYVARLVAEGHAGSLTIESGGDNMGTTVRVRLPRGSGAGGGI